MDEGARSTRTLVRGLAVIAAVLLALVLPAASFAASGYRDPPSYKGIDKPPKTKPPQSSVVDLSAAGAEPDVLVDEAGTAHIVWNEGRGDQADVARYCRLERGAKTCDASATLSWNKTYGTGDGPQYNIDNGGPRIVRIGDQLLVLSKRYPTVGESPAGFSSSNVIGWVSNDGGDSWSNAAFLGSRNLGQLAVVGPENDPTVVNLAHDPFCGGMCVTTYKSGVYSTSEGVLNTDPNSNYNATLIRDGSSLIGAFSGLSPDIWLRRWNGTGSITNPSSWSASAAIPGDEPELAGGPAGAFMMAREGYFDPYEVSKLSVGAGNVVERGPPVGLTDPDESVSAGRIIEDASGRLAAAWQEDGTGVRLATSTTGQAGFSQPQKLVGGDDNGQLELDAYADGGGFAVVNRTAGVVGEGQLQAVGFGSQGPTNELGLGDLPGGGNIGCQQVGFGAFDVETVQGCFLKGTGKNSKTVVTGGPIELNGLVIRPDPGSQLVIDAEALTIDTIGKASVLVENGNTSVTLYHGPINRNLSGLKPGDRLFEFPVETYVADIFGFDVAADMPVMMTANGVRIPVDVELPPEFGGFTGHAELTATKDVGLELDSLQIRIGPVPLGVLVVENVQVDWQSGGTWRGEGKLSVPAGGSIEARFEFLQGDFKSAGFDYTLAPPQAIGPFVYLLSVGGDFAVDPVTIAARASFGAGAAVQGQAPVKLDGQFTMTFPKGQPASFRFDGGVELFLIHVGDGFMEFQTDGYAQFGGGSQLSIGPLSGGVDVNGFVEAGSGRYGADISGNAQICLEVDVELDTISVCGGVGAEAAVSSIGLAACARINPPDPIGGFSGGLAVRWADVNPAVLISPIVASAQIIDSIAIPCTTAGYRIPPPRRVAGGERRAGAEAFAVDGGLPTATVLVEGTGGAPDVTLTGPGGQTVSSGEPTKAGFVVGVPGTDASWVVLNDPKGGTWTMSPNPGSPAVSEVRLSEGYEAAEVARAKVRKGSIDYRLSGLGSGQKVVFREKGKFGVATLGSTTKPKGTLRFKPTRGAGGNRKVEALITRDGLITDRVGIGSYKAPPPPRPGPVKKLRARRSGTAVTVQFVPSKVADTTSIRARGSDGAELAASVTGRKRKVQLKGLRWQKRVKVTVQSATDEGRSGPKRSLTVR